MNQQEYLSQISNNVRPPKAPKPSFFSSAIFKWGLIVVAAIVGIAIFGAVISGNKKSVKDMAIALKLHTDGTMAEVKNFQPYIKNSSLRANAASLNSVLSNFDSSLVDYMSAKYSYKKGSEAKKAKTKAETAQQALHDELFEAKINGMLDDIFAHKMAYEISLFQAEMVAIDKATSDNNLREILGSPYESLGNLYELLNNFSEAK
jgi:hypothetical protein